MIKSKKTKIRLDRILVSNIHSMLDKEGISRDSYKIIKQWQRMLIESNSLDKILDVVKRCFGIVSISKVVQVSANLDEIKNAATRIALKHFRKGDTFAVRASRTKDFPIQSPELARLIASTVIPRLENAFDCEIKVNLKNPDMELRVDVIGENALIYVGKIPAPGGLPFGSQGMALASLNEGTRSIVATWLLMKRGVKPVFFAFNHVMDSSDWKSFQKQLELLNEWIPKKLNILTI